MAPLLSNSKYSPVDGSSEGEAEKILEQIGWFRDTNWSRTRTRGSFGLLTVTPWFIAAAFASLSVFLFIRLQWVSDIDLGTYEDGFTTDFVFPSRIPLEKRYFTGSPNFFDNGTAWIPAVDKTAPWPENVAYFGDPSPEIEANWKRLISGRYFLATEEEAKRAWEEKRHEYMDELRGGYTAGFDMFHLLHCLNHVRQLLRPEYYPRPDPLGVHGIVHTDHCLDSIRQTLQCYGSTTLIPTKYRKGLRYNYIDSNQPHMCRSFDFIRAYTTSRVIEDEE